MKRELQRITGTIEKHQKGFGFIRQEEGADFFVAPDKMAGAMNGDTVEAEVLPPYMTRRSNEARVIKVIERKEIIMKKFVFIKSIIKRYDVHY